MATLAGAVARKSEFYTGARDTVPLMLGVFPFGVTFGMLALGAGLTVGETVGCLCWYLPARHNFLQFCCWDKGYLPGVFWA